MPWWLTFANLTLLFVYSSEPILRLYVFRMGFFQGDAAPWNFVDVFVVISGWAFDLLGSSSFMSAARLLRLARIVKLMRGVTHLRELYLILNGMAGAMKAMF